MYRATSALIYRDAIISSRSTIDLDAYNIPRFELLIERLLLNNKLAQTSFNRALTPREQQILVNLNIAAHYNANFQHQQQIVGLAAKYNFEINKRFDYTANVSKHDVQLHGLSIIDFYTGHAQKVIANLQRCKYLMLFESIVDLKIETVKHLVVYGVNINANIFKRLPLELACEVGALDIVKYLVNVGKADPDAQNYNQINALQQACFNKHISIINYIISSEKFKTCHFLDISDPGYDECFDILKIIIDMDDASYMCEIVSQNSNIEREVIGEVQQLHKMRNYAAGSEKMDIVRYLTSLISNVDKVSLQLMQAIRTNNIPVVMQSVQNGFNINLLIGNKFPIQLICELGRTDMLKAIFSSNNGNIVWFDYKDEGVVGYNRNLDLIRFALKKDNVHLLDMLLKNLDGEQEYLFRGLDRYNKILSKAKLIKSVNVLSYLAKLQEQRAMITSQLFSAAVAGDTDEILSILESGIDINTSLGCKSLAHILCECGHTRTLECLRNSTKYNLDINVADESGKYPLTIACKYSRLKIVKLLLAHELTRFYHFKDRSKEHYEKYLDPVRCSITNNNPDLLEFLLKFWSGHGETFVLSAENLSRLHEYAIKKDAAAVILQLEQYLNLVQHGRNIFDRSLDADLQNTIAHQQSIGKVESTFISSIKGLCEYFDIQIVSSRSGDYKILKSSHNFDAIFCSLKRMISNARDVTYKVYTSSKNKDNEVFELISDEQYQGYAADLYELFGRGTRGSLEFNGWHSSWCEDNTENIVLGSGLSVKDVWCLAILAAQDKRGLPGKELTDQEISDREQILVRALVDSNRAYNCNNDELRDYGGPSQKSCIHGIAIRALLCLSHLHKKIVIESNPIEWAAEVAKKSLLDFFETYANKDYVLECYRSRAYQLTLEQKSALSAFYKAAQKFVARELEEKIGLVKSGGYLLAKDFAKILESLEYIQLTGLTDNIIHSNAHVGLVPDFRLVSSEYVISDNGLHLEQYKLPFTSESMYAAILISAYNAGIANININTTSDLRSIVSEILIAAFYNPEKLETLMKMYFAYKQQGISSVVFRRILMHKFQSIYPRNSEDQNRQIFNSVKLSAVGDNICLMLISAVYGCRIRLFDFNGGFVLDAISQELFVPLVDAGKCLHLTAKVNYHDANRTISFSACNALVIANSWQLMSAYISDLRIRTCAEQSQFNKQKYKEFEVMAGCHVDGFDQIMLNSNNTNLFEAVLLGAKNLSLQLAFAVENANDLRRIVADEILMLLESVRNEQHGYHDSDITSRVLHSLLLHNQTYNTMFSGPDEYVAAIPNVNFYPGVLEMEIISKILQVNIHVHALDYDQPMQINSHGADSTVRLYLFNNAYNLLVERNSWRKLDVVPITNKRSRTVGLMI